MAEIATHIDYYQPEAEQYEAALRREQGGISAGRIIAVGAIALGTFLSINAYHYGQADATTGVVAGKGGNVTVKQLHLEPIAWDCRAEALYGVTGKLPFNAVVSGKELPIGTNVNIKEPTTVADTWCLTGSNKDTKTADLDVKINEVAGKEAGGYQAMRVEIPLDSLQQNVQFVDKNMVPTKFNFTKIAGGFTDLAGGSVGIMCNTATLYRHKDDCDKFSNGFTEWSDELDAKAGNSAENTILKLVQEKAVEDWPTIKAAYAQSYKDQAIAAANGDKAAGDAVEVVFTSASGQDTPDPNNNVFDALRKKGLVKNDFTKADTSKLQITKLPPASETEKAEN